MPIILTALLSSATTAGAIYLLWKSVLMPDLEQRAGQFTQQATADASAELAAAGSSLADESIEKARLQLVQTIEGLSQDATATARTELEQTGRRLADEAIERAREQLAETGQALAADATADAVSELNAAAEALIPRFRQAVRDGIQDAVLTPPTDRIGQTARDMTNVGVGVVESSFRRIFGPPSASGRARPPGDRES